MPIYVHPTDGKWARYLADLQLRDPTQTEVNFWVHSATPFRALAPGERFLFRSKKSEGGQVIGGGLFADNLSLRVSEAGRFYGEANGAGSRESLLAAINAYRRKNGSPPEADPEIGCILLYDVSFVPTGAGMPLPENFRMTATRGKGYATSDADFSVLESLFAEVLWRSGVPSLHPKSDAVDYLAGPTHGMPRLIVPRRDQRWFQSRITTAYQRRCAITGSHIAPTLQAAHIRPISQEGQHRVDNGLLLRSDVHTLFDNGYLGIDEQYRLRVSRRLAREFGNGGEFYAREGTVISLPEQGTDRPNPEIVKWHMDTTFIG